jgi:D-3-phosphoglycerate dehydrogenase/C-terminal binding protein
MRILCANWYGADNAELERWLFPKIDFIVACGPEGAPGRLPEEARRDADAVINYSAVADLAEKPDAFPKARIVVRAGVGFDNADLKGFGARGVPVCNVPDYGTTEVADHAIALMLALRRGTATYDSALRGDPKAGWNYRAAPLVRRLKGATFGIVGLGRIGLATARRAAAFDMQVVFYDPYLATGTDLATGYARVHSLGALMAMSDVVSVHVPLSPETRGMINAAALTGAKSGLVLVNTARGPIVDLDALTDALRSGTIGGAALDVLPKEPADPDHPLIRAWRAREPWVEGRLVLTPHAAFYSPTALEDLRRKAVEVVVAYLDEGRLTNCVNGAFLEKTQNRMR